MAPHKPKTDILGEKTCTGWEILIISYLKKGLTVTIPNTTRMLKFNFSFAQVVQ